MCGNNFLSWRIWHWRLEIAAIAALASLVPAIAHAQQIIVTGPEFSGVHSAPSYSDRELDQMLASVALYPDGLLSLILMATTYPYEVVEAKRWLQKPENSGLSGDEMAAALEQQSWDMSVKSLAAFPPVIDMMGSNFKWTKDVGDAFLDDQASVMNSVQRLRWRAQNAGTLKATKQQNILFQDNDIIIEPVNPQVVYVPYYNPSVVYGSWQYPDYPPFYFPPPADAVHYDRPEVNFGLGIITISSLWAWDHWDWKHRRINVDNTGYHKRHPGQKKPPASSVVWDHNPNHRHDIPYRNQKVYNKFQRNQERNASGSQGFDDGYRVNSRSRPNPAPPPATDGNGQPGGGYGRVFR